MPAVDYTNLNKAIAAFTAAADNAVTTDSGAEAAIRGIGATVLAAVTTALDNDDAANQTTVDNVTTAINDTVDHIVKSSASLGAAIANVSQP